MLDCVDLILELGDAEFLDLYRERWRQVVDVLDEVQVQTVAQDLTLEADFEQLTVEDLDKREA